MFDVLNWILIIFVAYILLQVALRMSLDLYFEWKERIRNEKTKH